MCSAVVNGVPHGGQERTTLCQLHMRKFKDGDAIYIEPWRARAFPILKDLIVDRGALDKLIQAAGYVSCHTGGVPDGNAILVGKPEADYAMDAAECIGCGACVAACPNGAAMLFAGAKVSQLAELPQGQVEAPQRVAAMVKAMADARLRQLQQPLRVRGGLPQGHQGEVHRPPEPGVHQGPVPGEDRRASPRPGSPRTSSVVPAQQAPSAGQGPAGPCPGPFQGAGKAGTSQEES